MEKVDTVELGARLRELRTEPKLTQARLAEAAGIEVQSLSRIERGEYEPSLSACVALAEALGVTVDVIARGASSARPDPSAARMRMLIHRASTLTPEQIALFLKLMGEVSGKRGD